MKLWIQALHQDDQIILLKYQEKDMLDIMHFVDLIKEQRFH
jgi:hypothetical protein